MNSIIKKSMNKFFNKDAILLDVHVHEICMVHRIAIYLEELLNKEGYRYNVDIEYNRDMNNSKKVNGKERRVDLIVHRRLTKDNLIYIEFKKDDNCDVDLQKLIDMKIKHNYQYIYAISIQHNKIYQLLHNNELKEV